jgi:GTP cyclohydrolase IA
MIAGHMHNVTNGSCCGSKVHSHLQVAGEGPSPTKLSPSLSSGISSLTGNAVVSMGTSGKPQVQSSAVQGSAGLPKPVDVARIERAVREILAAIGEDPNRDGLLDTPARVARAYSQIFGGLQESPAKHLARVFQQDGDEVIVCRDIEFYSMCEHHLLPFFGKAHVAYLPRKGEVVGLSKLARTVEVFARRPQVQERLTNQIADALVEHVGAEGVAVVIESEHLCMKMRGISKQSPVMVTSALRGVFKHQGPMRTEVLSMLMPKS